MKKLLFTAASAAVLLTSCGSADHDISSQDMADSPALTDRETQEEHIVTPVQGTPPLTVKIGYGQGVEVDDKNRPIGALDFNEKYGRWNATAINTDSKKILLTFDQGYENGLTGQILDTLKEKKVKAVFFVVQDYAERNPELVQRMIDEGHTIGNHSVSHPSMPSLSPTQCADEVNGLNDYMEQNFGVRPTLFRPPMGEFSELSLAMTDRCGCKSMLWSFAYADWDVDNQPDPAEAKQKLVGAAHEGAIYLLHSVSQTNADILGDFIDEVRAEGFEFE
ncbi:peptidoglycan-N-acetylmuramic acid deacetylase [Ruminococcus sp. YE71]|uniref:polysaccharide deacetylase family protein n=1 Tax=unclassified Ruminococcus TaxID=2608920 RepID=UPI00088ED2D6|nr:MULTISPECIES: polysaccharide deacetylase family protein [unclassified Ruminococcus]SDA27291.1 peptidoglycan-N-acetylmuramic acid deacetylase [Ruminococcus sp. YE78]SFW45257.1 peptidoglycan-N-acetylmuramic acid deacetylase [Ruminococcus sp. YE71]